MCYLGSPSWLRGEEPTLPIQETQEMRLQFLGWEDPLEEGVATHSSILAWEITWTEELGRLQSVRKESDVTERWSTHTHTHTHCINYLLLYSKLSQSLSAWSISKHYLMKFLQAKNRSSLMVWFWLGVSREGDTKLSARAAVLWGLNGLWKTHLQGG